MINNKKKGTLAGPDGSAGVEWKRARFVQTAGRRGGGEWEREREGRGEWLADEDGVRRGTE